MPKRAKELTAIEVKRLVKPGIYAAGGVAGLLLSVTSPTARSWILRYSTGETKTSSTGREFAVRRDLGLGAYPEISLALARQKAVEAKEQLRAGVDPVQAKKATRAKKLASSKAAMTFDEAAAKYMAKMIRGVKSDKHAAQWETTLATYASPVIGKLLVADIDRNHVMRVIEPEWQTKTETMNRVRGRIEQILSWCVAEKSRKEGLNPAAWKDNLAKSLPAPSEIHKVKHHRAMEFEAIPAFMPLLREREGMAAKALEFAILTAARSGEVRGAMWSEINLEKKVWSIPAERMKADRPHRVPLSDAAMDLLASLPRMGDLIFPAPRGGKLSDMTLSAVCKRMKIDAVPHGFRSTFRDWTAEATSYPNEVCEKALAHGIRDKSEAAYRRGDLLKKRRELMQDWADYLRGKK